MPEPLSDFEPIPDNNANTPPDEMVRPVNKSPNSGFYDDFQKRRVQAAINAEAKPHPIVSPELPKKSNFLKKLLGL